MIRVRSSLLVALSFALPVALVAQAQPSPAVVAAVDQAFAQWNTKETPGCAVGV